MDRVQIGELVKSGESEVLEFKRTTGERREAVRSLCAMLNHRGGRVIIGVEPDGTVVGQDVTDKTMEDVAQEIKEIDPPVFPSVDRVPIGNGREAIVLVVTQGQSRPYTYKERAFRRVGNTSPEMSREEYNRMLLERLHGEVRWENQPADGWSVGDLDAAEITRTVEEAVRRGRAEDPGTRDATELLRGLGLVRDGVMLRAAAILFGRAEVLQTRLPQCLLRVAKFKGSDKAEFVDNRQFHGNVFRLLAQAGQFLSEGLPVAGRVVPGLFERVDDPALPPAALREALANAVCHRDYSVGGGSVAVGIFSDRVEITSSGTLHFGLTVDALYRPHESLPWNPLIARVLYRRGIIEAWGRGTIRMAELSQRAGQPRPDIEEGGGCITVKFRLARWAPSTDSNYKLTSRQLAILNVLAESGSVPLRTLRAKLSGWGPEWAIKEELSALKSLGLIDTVGHARGAVWFLKASQNSK